GDGMGCQGRCQAARRSHTTASQTLWAISRSICELAPTRRGTRAGEPGVGPGPAGPKPAVLPLHHSPAIGPWADLHVSFSGPEPDPRRRPGIANQFPRIRNVFSASDGVA